MLNQKPEYMEFLKSWEENPKNRVVEVMPLSLDIELTNRCDLKCDMCPFHGKDALYWQEPYDMDFDLYKKIIKEGVAKGLKSVKLNFGGEPLLYEKLELAVHFAKELGVLHVRLNSNGLTLTRVMSVRLIVAGLDMFILSDYGIDYQVRNATALQATKQLFNKDNPILRVKTDNPEKWEGIADEIETPKYYDYHTVETDLESSGFECEMPWQRMLILADGTACRCSCGMLMIDKMFGNVWSTSIEELWGSRYMNYLRFCHDNHRSELVEACTVCPYRVEEIAKARLKK